MRTLRWSATGVAGISGSLLRPLPSPLGPRSSNPSWSFPLEHWHNHASMIVEAPNGDLLVGWFHGSGERTADDVVIRGARLKKGREGVERAVPARRHAGLSRHQRHDVHRPAAAAVAAVADDPRQRVAHRADEIQDLVRLPARRSAALGVERGAARHARRRVQGRRSIASWIGCSRRSAGDRTKRPPTWRSSRSTPATS